MSILEALRAQLGAALWECCPAPIARAVTYGVLFEGVTRRLSEDARSFGAKDPASGGNALGIVQVGAFSRIFGPVHIGDDTFIGPHCTISEDIPASSRVTLRSQLQVVCERTPRATTTA